MQEHVVGILKATDLFAGVSEEGLAQLADLFTERRYAAEELIFIEHATGQELFIVARGEVSIQLALASEDEAVPLVALGPGQVFGEMAVVDSQARSATAQAVTDCVLLVAQQDALVQYMEQHPEHGFRIMFNLARLMAGRIRRTNQRILDNITWGMI